MLLAYAESHGLVEHDYKGAIEWTYEGGQKAWLSDNTQRILHVTGVTH